MHRNSRVGEQGSPNRIVSEYIFYFNSPRIYFRCVELGLLFQCFYVSVWATQLLPLTSESRYMSLWIAAFTLPVVFNFMMVGKTLHRSVLLKACTGLNSEIVGTICEECLQESHVIKDLQVSVRERLKNTLNERRKWKNYIKTHFFKFGLYYYSLHIQIDTLRFHRSGHGWIAL